jgi:D-ribose pyranase
LNSLLARVCHSNTLVIADRGFPYCPMIETVHISLVDGIPGVLDVVRALRANFLVDQVWMAEEFLKHNDAKTRKAFAEPWKGVPIAHVPHVGLKRRVPQAVGLIRTGETIQYANLILQSA